METGQRIVSNAPFWSEVFCEYYVHVIEGFRASAKKVDSTFANLETEAEEASAAEYARWIEMPADGENDPDDSDLAQRAEAFGINYYEVMSDARQGLRNGLVVSLHHLLEQLQLAFFRQLSSTASENPRDLQTLLLACGISTCGFPSHAKLKELRLAANTIKHGRGRSQRELVELRPDLFADPYSRAADVGARSPRVDLEHSTFEPLAGEGMYATDEDLAEWVDAAITYWGELSEALMGKWERYRAGQPLIDPPF
ncbi:MAG: hypothetical protein OXG35_26600 [Acidobacteria bacterium]|nr:hypothetical protein [Acidobacteriota bacterium]